MTEKKYHIGGNGPAPCKATKRACRYGGEATHYTDIKDANSIYEKRLTEESGGSFKNLNKTNTEDTVVINGFDVPKKHNEEFQRAYDTVEHNFDDSWGEHGKNTMELIHKYMLETDSLETSRTRAVFMDGDEVIKIPVTDEGIFASSNEMIASEKYQEEPDGGYIPMAKTDMYEENEVFYIRAERVDVLHFKSYNDVPYWVGMVDGGQVGYTKDKVLVAFDL